MYISLYAFDFVNNDNNCLSNQQTLIMNFELILGSMWPTLIIILLFDSLQWAYQHWSLNQSYGSGTYL